MNHKIPCLVTAVCLIVCSPFGCAAKFSCDTEGGSANFSSALGLPSADKEPGISIRQLIKAGDYGKAEQTLKSIVGSPEAIYWTGVLLLNEGKTFASIRVLEQAAQQSDSAQTEIFLGVDYFLLNQRRLAYEAVGNALRLDPRDALALYLRGRLEVFSEKFASAVEDFTSVLATEPADYRSFYYKGFSESKLGHTKAAEADLLRAVNVLECHHLKFSMAPYTLAKIKMESGEYEAALGLATEAYQMAETENKKADQDTLAEILLLRGKACENLGELSNAESDWLQSIAHDPLSSSAWYLLSTLYRREGRAADAANALAKFEAIRQEL